MIEHLQNHSLGLVHLLTALAAMFFGVAVIFSRKGTRKHRWMGRSYLAMMLALNVTALLNEVTSRIPGWSFGPPVIISSVIVVVAGARTMRITIPHAISTSPASSG